VLEQLALGVVSNNSLDLLGLISQGLTFVGLENVNQISFFIVAADQVECYQSLYEFLDQVGADLPAEPCFGAGAGFDWLAGRGAQECPDTSNVGFLR